jgi:hypothetical protein
MIGTKHRCPKCKKPLDADAFAPSQLKYGPCRACHRQDQRDWRKNNPEKNKAKKHRYYLAHAEHCKAHSRAWRKTHTGQVRARNIKKRGLSCQEFSSMVEAQGGRCLICNKKPDVNAASINYRVLHIDHDHQTGKVRGLLCSNCNKGLGFFHDDPTLLVAASTYLRRGDQG